MTLPWLLLLLDFWPLRRLKIERGKPVWPLLRRLLLEKLFLSLPAGAVAGVSAWGFTRIGAFSVEHTPFWGRFANALVSYGRYILETVWFRDLAVWYPLQVPPVWLAVVAAAGILLVTLLVLRQARPRPWLAAGWLWYLGTLLPMIGLPLISWATRFSYFPTIGLLIMLFWSLPDPGQFPRRRTAYWAGALAILAVLCAATHRQIGYWKDPLTLWEHDLHLLPGDSVAQTSLSHALSDVGLELYQHGDAPGAIKLWRRAAELNPHNMDLYDRLVDALSADGSIAEAIDYCRQALRINPRDEDTHFRLGGLLLKAGQLGDSAASYRQALAIDPRFAKAHAGLGTALCCAGHQQEGAAEFAEALRLDPRSADAHDGLGMTLLSAGKPADAAAHFDAAVRLNPNSSRSHNNFGVALAQLGYLDQAIQQFELAVQLDPAYAAARENVGRMRAERERLHKPS